MNNTDISRFIALILRHKPETINITLDEHGWADTQQLIDGIKKQYAEFDMAALEQIVAEDNKQRYAFNDDKSKIRARQGHSVQVDVDLKEVVPPETLYHGTGLKYMESIMKQGLISKSRLYVHLSKDFATAKTVGARHGQPVVLLIDSQRMQEDGYKFYLSENGVYLTESVPLEYIK